MPFSQGGAVLVEGFNLNWLNKVSEKKHAKHWQKKKGAAVQGQQKVVGSPNLP